MAVKPVKGKMTKAGKPRSSTTGKRAPVADQTTWRQRLQQSRLKFDDQQKSVYLTELAAHGLKGHAARIAGVCPQTVLDHVGNDPEFEAAYNAALDTYRDSLASEVRRRGRDGVLEAVYNKDGRVFEPLITADGYGMRHPDTGEIRYFTMHEDGAREGFSSIMVPASKRVYSDRMLELDVKRVDPSFRDKSSVDVNQTGTGVLVAPAHMTPEEWIRAAEAANTKAEDPREVHKRERAEAEKKAK